MKISDFNNIYIDKQIDMELDIFKEGEILTGEILELDGEEAIIYIRNLGKIRAFVEKELDSLIGEKVNFLVKSVTGHKIQLKPILESIDIGELSPDINNDKPYSIKILDEYGIEKGPVAIEYVESLIKYNVKLNKENILFGIKALEKLEQFLKMEEDLDYPVNLKGSLELGKEDIRNLLIKTKDPVENKIDFLLEKENEEIERNLLSNNRDHINPKSETKEDNNEKFYTIVKDLKTSMNILPENRDMIKSDLIKTIVIFSKYNIKPSMNNIKYFLELKENPHVFLEDLKLLEDIKYKKFTNIDKRAIIYNGSLKNIIKENSIDYKYIIEEIEKTLKYNSQSLNKETREKIEELGNKLELLEEINQELNYIYIPLNFQSEIYNDSIIFVKDRKKRKSPKDNISIFINLNTNNLGNININCQVIGDIINIKFYGLNNEFIDFFRRREDRLLNAMSNTVYTIGRIEYEYETEDDILDLLIINKGPIYHLNIGV